MPAHQDTLPDPVFVGGMARSGTHAMGRLLASHPNYHLIPVEARFHCDRGGLPDLLTGRVTVDQFLEELRGRFFRRGSRLHRGVQVILSEEALEAAIGDFERGFSGDPIVACGRLVRAVIDPEARQAGKPSWVEVSGKNIMGADQLLRMLPRARFIHMVRDGRDAAASVRNKSWGRDDMIRSLDLWQRRLRIGDAVTRAMPPETVLVMRLEDLVVRDRERSFRRLIDFLGVEDQAPLRDYFDAKIRAEQAHLGRWRTDLSEPEQTEVARHYDRLVAELAREGVSWVPRVDEPATTGSAS